MSDRIDHAAEAVRLLSQLAGSPVAVAHAAAAAAQVQATLALVEQQRVANLLMLSSWMQDATKEDIGYDLDKMRAGVAGEVWEALGLS